MGLDVMLGICPDLAAATAAEQEYRNAYEAKWEAAVREFGRGSIPTGTTDRIHAELKDLSETLGLDADGYHGSFQDAATPPSAVNPEHYCNLGYLRSSYNEAGLNPVLRAAGVPDLYAIFGVTEDAYRFRPDWAASLCRVNEAIGLYERHMATAEGSCRVLMFDAVNPVGTFNPPKTPADAMALFKEECLRYPKLAPQDPESDATPQCRSYGNGVGDFWLDGIKLRGVIPGYGRLGVAQRAVVYLVVDSTTEGSRDWYMDALLITREMIEFVLAQPNGGDYYLRWSA